MKKTLFVSILLLFIGISSYAAASQQHMKHRKHHKHHRHIFKHHR